MLNDDTGACNCMPHFEGLTCNKCKENYYNYPMCEGELSYITRHLTHPKLTVGLVLIQIAVVLEEYSQIYMASYIYKVL